MSQQPYQPPPPTSTNAIIALSLGVASFVFCCGPLTAIPAFIVGRIAVREIDRAPGTLQGRGLATAGWILGLVATLLFLLGVAALLCVYLSFDCTVIGGDGVPSYDCP